MINREIFIFYFFYFHSVQKNVTMLPKMEVVGREIGLNSIHNKDKWKFIAKEQDKKIAKSKHQMSGGILAKPTLQTSC